MAPRKTKTFNRDKLIQLIRETFPEDVPIFHTTGEFYDEKLKTRNIDFHMKHKLSIAVGYDPLIKAYKIERHSNGGMFARVFNNQVQSLQKVTQFLRLSDEEIKRKAREYVTTPTSCAICSESISEKNIDVFHLFQECERCHNTICLRCVLSIAASLTNDDDNIKCPFCREGYYMTKDMAMCVFRTAIGRYVKDSDVYTLITQN